MRYAPDALKFRHIHLTSTAQTVKIIKKKEKTEKLLRTMINQKRTRRYDD